MMVGRMETLTDYTPGRAEEKLTELHGNMVVVTGALGDKLQTLEDMVLAVSTMAEEAVAKLSKDLEDQRSGQWGDWGILDDQGFQTLQKIITELEARAPPVTAAEIQ